MKADEPDDGSFRSGRLHIIMLKTSKQVTMPTLRPYQARIVSSVANFNAIVKMPTGSGKTPVAAKVIENYGNKGDGRTSLFLVPTRELVDQQAATLATWCPGTTFVRYTGGMADPVLAANGRFCIVSTPQAFLLLQKRKPGFGWNSFGSIVFDEVHHVLKEHPYRRVALLLKEHRSHAGATTSPQVLGLTASLTYQVKDRAIRSDLDRINHELQIEKMEAPSLEELVRDGYEPQNSNKVEFENTKKVPAGVVNPADRKPHRMHQVFINRVRNKSATPFSQWVWNVVLELEDQAKARVPSFKSPLSKAKLSSWEDYAHKLAAMHPDNKSVLISLECWYVTLRLLVQSWEEDEQLALQWLQMNNGFDLPPMRNKAALTQLKAAGGDPERAFRLDRLRFHLAEKRKLKGTGFRCIIFVQQRITAVVMSYLINNDEHLSSLGLKSGFVASRDSKITPTIKVTKDMVADTVSAFRNNSLNVLVATSVIEEGFDVPAANVVASYDHLKNSVELSQRFGRARQQDSCIV